MRGRGRLVPHCDVVTINAPLHPETENLFDTALLAQMKRGDYLVNTARGQDRESRRRRRALESGRLAGYAGDVWFPQPAPRNHPWRTMPQSRHDSAHFRLNPVRAGALCGGYPRDPRMLL